MSQASAAVSITCSENPRQVTRTSVLVNAPAIEGWPYCEGRPVRADPRSVLLQPGRAVTYASAAVTSNSTTWSENPRQVTPTSVLAVVNAAAIGEFTNRSHTAPRVGRSEVAT